MKHSLRTLALILGAFVALPVTAEMVARDQAGNSVTLHSKPCKASAWMKEWKTATVLYEGKTYQACWKLQESSVVVLDAGGDLIVAPAYAFKEETGT